MSVVTIADVEAMLGRDLTALEEARTFRLLQFAEARFEAYFPGFSIAAGTETVSVPSPRDGELWTPKYPVTSVITVTADDSSVSVASTNLKGLILAPGDVPGGTFTWELNLPWWQGVDWEITYDYGLDPLPLDIVEAIAGMVANVVRRFATNPDGVQSEMLGAYQVSYGDYAVKANDLGMLMSEDQLHALRKWSRTLAVSTRLR